MTRRRVPAALSIGALIALSWGCDGDSPSALQNPPPDSATVQAEWAAWIREHAYPITSLTSDDYSDLRFLESVLEGRRLVQLGEDSHGVGSYSDAKVRLIEFLHEEMGFDVVAFESSLFACYSANQWIEDYSALEAMRYSIFPVWHVEEVLALFEYIKATQQSPRPLILAGFDMQSSSWLALQLRPSFLRNVVASIDEDYAAEVEELEGRYRRALDFGGGDWAQLEADYGVLVEFFDRHEAQLLEAYAADPRTPLVARQTAWSTFQFARYQRGDSAPDKFVIRDQAMADNIDFLLERLYPDEKVVAWAHNLHIRHDQAATRWTDDGGYPSMGTWVAERHRLELYTVGLHAYRGRAARNDRVLYNHGPAPPGTIESLLRDSGLQVALVDLLHAAESDSTSWMRQPIDALSWGTVVFQMVPRDQYDAILFFEEVHPPHYVD